MFASLLFSEKKWTQGLSETFKERVLNIFLLKINTPLNERRVGNCRLCLLCHSFLGHWENECLAELQTCSMKDHHITIPVDVCGCMCNEAEHLHPKPKRHTHTQTRQNVWYTFESSAFMSHMRTQVNHCQKIVQRKSGLSLPQFLSICCHFPNVLRLMGICFSSKVSCHHFCCRTEVELHVSTSAS